METRRFSVTLALMLALLAPWVCHSDLDGKVLKRTIKSSLCVLAMLLPAWLQAAVVLQYHHISDQTPAATSTSPSVFAAHLDYLETQGFKVVPLAQLVKILRQGEPLPDRTVAITFDDGYRSIYDTALPLLKARGWPFTVFINSQPHDQRLSRFMSWQQLRELVAEGATLANHTHSHAQLLRRLPNESTEVWLVRVEGEITTAAARIEKETGQKTRMFAYPYGEFNRDLRLLLKRLGYVGFGQQSGPLAFHSDLQALPRFPFGGRYGGADDFALKVNSLPLPLAGGSNPIVMESEAGQPLTESLLPNGVLRPRLALQLASEAIAKRLNCFASGQGQIPVKVEGDGISAQASKPLAIGRSRYNCTAASGERGRFYWLSLPWIRKHPDGSWYPPG